MTGTVTGFAGGFYTVESPDAPAHLRVLNLREWQMRGAKVGDAVELRYEVTSRSGLWNVSKVLVAR